MLFNKNSEQRHGAQYPANLRALEKVGTLARTSPGVPAQCFIDPSVTIIGDLWTEGDVRIDGHICGNINCAQLIVGRDAVITGAIMAKEAVVRGRITGTIRAIRVILQYTARVESEIVYKLLCIDEGARFEGMARCRPNPLQDEAAVSAITELRQMMAEAGRINGARDGSKNLAPSKTGDRGGVVPSPETVSPTSANPATSA
jgi:cytoskeletal protein CcmA (bactofilin family)